MSRSPNTQSPTARKSNELRIPITFCRRPADLTSQCHRPRCCKGWPEPNLSPYCCQSSTLRCRTSDLHRWQSFEQSDPSARRRIRKLTGRRNVLLETPDPEDGWISCRWGRRSAAPEMTGLCGCTRQTKSLNGAGCAISDRSSNAVLVSLLCQFCWYQHTSNEAKFVHEEQST